MDEAGIFSYARRHPSNQRTGEEMLYQLPANENVLTLRSINWIALTCLFFIAIFHSNPSNASVQIESIPPQIVITDQEIEFQIRASFVDSAPKFRFLNAPAGATLIDHLDGTATFNWTPSSQVPDETVVIFQALDAELLAPASIKRVQFKRDSSVTESPAKALAATSNRTSSVPSSVESVEKLTAGTQAPQKIVQTAAIEVDSSITPPNSNSAIRTANAPPTGGRKITQLFSKESIILLFASYMVFVFVGENFNPILFRGHSILKRRWRFSRKVGLIVFLIGLSCLTLKNHFLLGLSSTAIVFIALTCFFVLPLSFKYHQSKVSI